MLDLDLVEVGGDHDELELLVGVVVGVPDDGSSAWGGGSAADVDRP